MAVAAACLAGSVVAGAALRPGPAESARPETVHPSHHRASPHPAAGADRRQPSTFDFVVSSFNVLGNSHTTSFGKRPELDSGTVRAGRAARLLRGHDVDVAGFQELQSVQLAALLAATHGEYAFYPGFSIDKQSTQNSIGWRRDVWQLVEARVLRTPYFEGKPRAMPVVLLRSRSTGLEAWFANFHNPANTRKHPDQQRFRDRAIEMHIRLVNRLLRQTGLPVLVTGDMNGRAEYFCLVTAQTSLHAARGGSNENGRCRAGHPRTIDWILGSPKVTFRDYRVDRSRFVFRTTDHPMIYSHARIRR